jgi:hypothetical protein
MKYFHVFLRWNPYVSSVPILTFILCYFYQASDHTLMINHDSCRSTAIVVIAWRVSAKQGSVNVARCTVVWRWSDTDSLTGSSIRCKLDRSHNSLRLKAFLIP